MFIRCLVTTRLKKRWKNWSYQCALKLYRLQLSSARNVVYGETYLCTVTIFIIYLNFRFMLEPSDLIWITSKDMRPNDNIFINLCRYFGRWLFQNVNFVTSTIFWSIALVPSICKITQQVFWMKRNDVFDLYFFL